MNAATPPTPELLTAIRNLNNAYKEFVNSNPLSNFDPSGIFRAQMSFGRALPKEIIRNAENYFHDNFDTIALNPEELYEGLELVSFYIILDGMALALQRTFTGFAETIGQYGNDISDLISYHPNFDVETGQWNN